MKNLNAILIFVRTADSSSFSVAAQRIGMSASGVSRSVAQLEKELGVRLINRTTRKLSLTEEGETFLKHCRSILATIGEAETALTQTSAAPRGKLRVQLPVVLGKRIIVPALPRLSERYPDLVVDVELSDRVPDLVKERLDVMIVSGELDDSRLAARKLCHLHFVTCAAPSYLERHGEPATPQELDQHKCLAYVDLKTGRYRDWVFSDRGKIFPRILSGGLNVNNSESLLAAAIDGAGIANIGSFIAAEAVAAGKLKIILRKYIAKGPAISVAYLPSPYLSPRVRVFVDLLRDIIPPDPPWDRMLTAP